MDIPRRKYHLFISIFVILKTVQAYPSGAPPAQCVDGFPFHGVAPRTNEAPFAILPEQNSYVGGKRIKIAIQALKLPRIKGFAIHVRAVEGDGRAVGTFVKYDSQYVQGHSVHAYNGQDKNCLTHTSSIDKLRLVFQYLPPKPSLGDLQVMVTFVANKAAYWPRQSQIIAASEATVTPFPPIQIDYNLEVPSFAGCGETNGCFYYPRDCTGLDCRYALTYRLSNDGTKIQFEAIAETPGYVTMAFSGDDKMGQDETVTCIHSGDHITIQHGLNLGHCNDRQPLDQLSDLAVTRSGDKIFCKWSRPLQVVLRGYYNMNCKNGDKYDQGRFRYEFDIVRVNYNLFVARGSVFPGTDVISKHDQLPIISERKIDFQSIKKEYGWQLPTFLKLHGALGILAWLGLIAVSMTTSRHFQTSLTRLKCGKPLWYQIHVSFNILGTLASGGCVAVMLYRLKDQNFLKMDLYYLIHGAAGMGATGFAFIQFFMGVCRPSEISRGRRFWLITHRILGILALVAACAAILMGVNMEFLEKWLRRRLLFLIVAYIGFILIMNITLSVIGCFTARKTVSSGASIEDTQDSAASLERSAQSQQKPKKTAKSAHIVIFVILILGSMALLLLTVATIGMA